jgi:hypothetical protein
MVYSGGRTPSLVRDLGLGKSGGMPGQCPRHFAVGASLPGAGGMRLTPGELIAKARGSLEGFDIALDDQDFFLLQLFFEPLFELR